jgi:hypothetical protein
MNEDIEFVNKHLSDMLAAEEHILQAIERQRNFEEVRDNVDVNELIIKIERVLKQHVEALEELNEEYDVDQRSSVKEALTNVMGRLAGLYDKLRDHPLSRILRDNYTALSLSAMGYTTMHTYGLAVKEDRIADLAQSHLKDVTPLLVEISEVLPGVTANEITQEHDYPVDGSVGEQARQNTQEAWNPSTTESDPQPA